MEEEVTELPMVMVISPMLLSWHRTKTDISRNMIFPFVLELINMKRLLKLDRVLLEKFSRQNVEQTERKLLL